MSDVTSWQDFSTPSLSSEDKPTEAAVMDDDDNDGDDDDDEQNAAPEVAQLCLRRHWEERYQQITRSVIKSKNRKKLG